MKRSTAPLRAVVKSHVGPRSQRIVMPDGSVAIVCGDPMRTDELECGHIWQGYGGARNNRHCKECGKAARLPLE